LIDPLLYPADNLLHGHIPSPAEEGPPIKAGSWLLRGQLASVEPGIGIQGDRQQCG
jgi:hypothetical protein